MMEEHFMRGWTHGHDRLSADLDRGFRWLGRAARQVIEPAAPSHASSDSVCFEAPARHTAERIARVRTARRR